MPELSLPRCPICHEKDSLSRETMERAGQYVRCSRCGWWVGPSDPAWLPDGAGGVECRICVTGLDLGPGVSYHLAEGGGDEAS